MLLRALVGVGEASYSTIAPTIIADIFAKTARTRALMVFYFAIPVGRSVGVIHDTLLTYTYCEVSVWLSSPRAWVATQPGQPYMVYLYEKAAKADVS